MVERILKVRAGVRYFEDTKIRNNHQDWHVDNPDQPEIPGAELVDDEWLWCPEIDPDTGIICNWKEGGWEARVHYKVCDECEIDYYQDGEKICDNDGEYYVPDFLCPGGEGCGDYMIMDIDEMGQIQNWSVSDFNDWVKRHAVKTIIPGLIPEES